MEKLRLADKASRPIKIKNIKDVAANVELSIDAFKFVDTKYGSRLAVLVEKDLIYLPKSYALYFTSHQQVEDELSSKQYYMTKTGCADADHFELEFRETEIVSRDTVDVSMDTK